MASLENVAVKDSYTSLLKLSGNTDTLADGTGSNAIQVVDGSGDASPLYLNTDRLGIGGQPNAKLDISGDTGTWAGMAKVFLTDVNSNSSSRNWSIGNGGTAYGALSFIVSNSADGVPADSTGTAVMVLDGVNKNLGVGTASPEASLDILNGQSMALQLGGDSGADSLTDSTRKFARIGAHHYTNAEEPVGIAVVDSNSTHSYLTLGGGSGSVNNATHVRISASSATNSANGADFRMIIDSNSRISLSNNDSGTGGADSSSANTILGYLAGANIGSEAHTNVLIGHKSGNAMIGGRENVAIGVGALDADQYGEYSIAIGASALGTQNDSSNSGDDGMSNIGIGRLAGSIISNGQYNICIGESSGSTGTNNLSTGDKNVLVGRLSGSGSADAQNRVAIGHEATGVADNSVTLGNADVTDVYMSQDSGAYVHSQNVPNHVANTMSSPYYRFDGVDDKIQASNVVTAYPFSLSAVFKADSSSAYDPIISLNDANGSTVYYVLALLNLEVKVIRRNTTEVTTSTGKSVVVGTTNHIVAVFNSATSIDVYLNGSSIYSGSSETSVTMNTDTDVTLLGIDRVISPSFANQSLYNAKVWNKALTATEIKDDYSGASVPFKYKGANQTASYTSDFTSGADSWANAGRATVTGNSDSVGGVDDTLKIIADATSGASHYARRNSATATRRAYRIKFDYYIPSGQTVDGFQFGLQTTLNQFSTTGSWQTNVSFEVNDLSSGDLFLYLTDGGSQTVAGNAENEYVALKNITVVPIGAVCELDGSSAGSKVWGDKSGNGLHGTVGAGTLDATAPTLENTPYDSGTEYEEGTFTPSIGEGTSYNAQVGNYTKIGRKVTCIMSLNINAIGTGSTHTISGLPYPSMNATEASGYVGFFSGSANTVSTINPSVNNDASTITLCSVGGSGATATATATAIFANSTSIRINVTYFTD